VQEDKTSAGKTSAGKTTPSDGRQRTGDRSGRRLPVKRSSHILAPAVDLPQNLPRQSDSD
jgi:hypothetical protein